MAVVRLIHWKAAEAEPRIEKLESLGHHVQFDEVDGPAVLKAIRQDPPDVFVIDLSRLPSHGREVGNALRQTKATRHVPLVFVAGSEEKVAKVKQLLPDAIFTTWGRIRSAVNKAVESAPAKPVVPSDIMAGYSGTPLPKKLGIKPQTSLVVLQAPENFLATLGDLPEDVKLRKTARGQVDLIIWFVQTEEKLTSGIDRFATREDDAHLWICWPKKTSNLPADITQNDVRKIALAAGMVDYKICAIDQDWSGLKFCQRK